MSRVVAARSSASNGGGSSTKSRGKSASRGNGYFQASERPLTSLVFLLPFLAVYEIGTRHLSSDIIAFTWMQDIFALMDMSGRHLPALSVIVILLGWHFKRRDRWQVSPGHVVTMFFESTALAVPLILLGLVAARYVPMLATNKMLPSMIVLSVGAGIYEELVFRLIAFWILGFVFIRMGFKAIWANLLMVVISSLCFSLYHYLGHEGFQLRSFAFRTLAGFYFGAVFAVRGFGLSAGSHAAYDIVVNLLRALP
jgi:membrane protease YdiL (CAAX protease family)